LVEFGRNLGGGFVTEAGVQPDGIVEDLEIYGNCPSGFRFGHQVTERAFINPQTTRNFGNRAWRLNHHLDRFGAILRGEIRYLLTMAFPPGDILPFGHYPESGTPHTVPVLEGEPGVECQVDFGQMGWLVDPETERPADGARVDLHRGGVAAHVRLADPRPDVGGGGVS
jgi:hypothetical protein